MPRAWGQVTDLVLLALADVGGRAGLHTLAEETGVSSETLRKVLARIVAAPRDARRAHIGGWDDLPPAPGLRAYPRAVYVLGPGKNVGRPAPKPRADIVRAWYNSAQARLQTVQPGLSQKAAARLAAEINRRTRQHEVP